MFRICALSSGSSGNAYYAENDEGAVIIDAGLTYKALGEAITKARASIHNVRGVLISHDHSDHVSGAGVWYRKQKWPLLLTKGTRHTLRGHLEGIPDSDLKVFSTQSGSCKIKACGFTVEAYKTPHDATEPVGYVLEYAGKRCGILTDLGHPFKGLSDILSSLDGVFLESNYDPSMLAANPKYPPHLKRRISSKNGHLANKEAGLLLRDASSCGRLKQATLSHLSKENNRPELALRTVMEIVNDKGSVLFSGAGKIQSQDGNTALQTVPQLTISVAPRSEPSGWMVF